MADWSLSQWYLVIHYVANILLGFAVLYTGIQAKLKHGFRFGPLVAFSGLYGSAVYIWALFQLIEVMEPLFIRLPLRVGYTIYGISMLTASISIILSNGNGVVKETS